MPLTNIAVEQNTETAGVHLGKLAQVIDDRVDDNVKVAVLVVLAGCELSSLFRGNEITSQSSCVAVARTWATSWRVIDLRGAADIVCERYLV